MGFLSSNYDRGKISLLQLQKNHTKLYKGKGRHPPRNHETLLYRFY